MPPRPPPGRRAFLRSAGAALAATTVPRARPAPAAPAPRVLLREALQYENIGDSGRVPGTLRLLYAHVPGIEVTLWPWRLHDRERALLRRAFPALRFADGELDRDGQPGTPSLAAAWERCGFLVSASKNAVTYRDWARTGRPYGLFGTAFDPVTSRRDRPEGDTLDALRVAIDRRPSGDFDRQWGERALYDRAAFIFCRDTLSLRYLRQQGLRPPVLEFGPEGCFALALRDERRAEAWRRRHGLHERPFLCVVPRLRYTPYYQVRQTPREPADLELDALNARSAIADHAPLRELIARWVERTGGRVVACPEMTYQIRTAREQLVDPLPETLRRHVVWRDEFWLADEAAAIYARASAVVSLECHSPIIALAAGTPAIYLRQPVDTVKGQMYRDLGLGDWVREVETTSGRELADQVMAIHADPAAARERVRGAMERVATLQRGMTRTLARAAGA